jgi:3-dehydroquinate synthase
MNDVVIDGLPYPIVVSDAAAARLGALLPAAATVALVCDVCVAARGGSIARELSRAGVSVLGQLAIHGGERCKSLRTLERLWGWLLRRGADRRTVLVAVGGGTVTDVAGFAAATFMRGIPWLPVPTTVLGMADAAIGGKTAIDLAEGKNLAGAFWAPVAVAADLGALATLPRREIMTGLAEIVKAAVVGDPRLLDLVNGLRTRTRRAAPADWRGAIVAAAAVKVRIVASDPREAGPREALNLGHTLGHAFEHAARGRMPHGEAVAIGLRGEGLLALRAGFYSAREHARVLRALEHCGLPLAFGRLETGAILRALRSDKKRRNRIVGFTLPERIGSVRTGVAVDDADLRAVIAQCARAPGAEELGE